MKTAEKFWMVMQNSQNSHYSYESAKKEAHRLAMESSTNDTFFILEVTGAFSRGPTPIEELRVETPCEEAPADK